MKQLVVLRGLPGSGKSTWAKQWVAEERGRVRVNKDDIRMMLFNVEFDPKNEAVVHDVFLQNVRIHLSRGRSVVADNTHLKASYVKELHALAASIGNVEVIEKWMNVDLNECIRRNFARERQVPVDVLRQMDKSREAFRPDKVTAYVLPVAAKANDSTLPKAIIVDLDGTLALINDRSPYDATNADKDHPNIPVVELVKAMHAQGYEIVFLSGREAKYEAPTRRFIEQHVCEHEDTCIERPIQYELFMRNTSDQRKDSIVKRELYETYVAPKYNVMFTVDDRPQVVRMWRNELGLTCLQINDVEF